jgi:hypothetical protein
VELPQQHDTLLPPLQLIQDTLSPLLPLLPAVAADTAAAALRAHLHKLQVMLQFMARQARGLPTGAHAAFKGLGVDAATLRVLVRNDAGQIVGPVGYTGEAGVWRSGPMFETYTAKLYAGNVNAWSFHESWHASRSSKLGSFAVSQAYQL